MLFDVSDDVIDMIYEFKYDPENDVLIMGYRSKSMSTPAHTRRLERTVSNEW